MSGPRLLLLGVIAAVLALPAPARAQGKPKVVGVYLPASVEDRDSQFKFGEALAAALGKALDAPVSSRSFGRYEDFAKAVADGTLSYVVTEGFVLAAAKGDFTPAALATTENEVGQRWAIVAEHRSSVAEMANKRLAMVKGPGSLDAMFVSNVLFGGELPPRHFQLVPVPAVESCAKAIEAKKADAALVPLAYAPKGLTVLFRSGRVTGAVLASVRGDGADLKKAVGGLGALPPFARFVPAPSDAISDLRKRITSTPGARLPFIVESPTWRPSAGSFSALKGLNPVFPSFTQFVEASTEQPND